MKSMWQEETRREIVERLAHLGPTRQPQWGRMTAPRMVAHIAQSFRSAIGELPVKSKNLPLRFSPLKEIIIYWLPFPRNAPTAPELLALEPTDWATDMARLQDLIRRFAAKDPASAFPNHAAFGRLTGAQWGILMYRHTDHHLRQFGV
jgi:hypothetical protein